MSPFLLAVNAAARKKYGKNFKDLTAEQQEELKAAIKTGEFRKQEESMNIKEIASKLVALREGSSSALIMNGQLRDELGFDGYSEALRRRWIVADMEGSGMVQFNQSMTVLQEMRVLAEEFKKDENKDVCPSCGKKGCDCKTCPDCNKVKCECKSVKEDMEYDEDEEWQSMEPVLKSHFKKHPQTRSSFPRASEEELEALWKERHPEVRKQWRAHRASYDKPPEVPAYSLESLDSILNESLVVDAHHLAQHHAVRPRLNEIATLGRHRLRPPRPLSRRRSVPVR
jgi:hypothetical protein